VLKTYFVLFKMKVRFLMQIDKLLIAYQIFVPSLDIRSWARASSLSRLHDHTQTTHTRGDSSGRVIRPSQRTVPDSTQQTDIHDPGGIRNRNPSKRADADPRVRPRGHWSRHIFVSCGLQLPLEFRSASSVLQYAVHIFISVQLDHPI
jgi:hypothetical protein